MINLLKNADLTKKKKKEYCKDKKNIKNLSPYIKWVKKL